jgi:hypothetical protein
MAGPNELAGERQLSDAQRITDECSGGQSLQYTNQSPAQFQVPRLEQRVAQIHEQFRYHPPTPAQQIRYELLRHDFTELAARVVKSTPPGSAQDAAIEALHIAMMLANRAIALD